MFILRQPSWGIALVLFFCLAATLESQVRQLFDVRIQMRDGVELSADIWMPSSEGKFPAILIRTPYQKNRSDFDYPELWKYFASHGYVLLLQDVRGRGDSDGEYNFLFQEREDGYDTVEWIANQPWSNGRVGMMGLSYLGYVQWMAARELPPHLMCIVPSAAGSPGGGGGAFSLSMLMLANILTGRLDLRANTSTLDWNSIFWHRPLITMDEFMGRRMKLWKDFLQHPPFDSYWSRIDLTQEDFQKINIPALLVTGWFDGALAGTLSCWDGMVTNSPAKDKQYLLIGPWNHPQVFFGGKLKMGELEFSADSVIDNKAIHLAFFDCYLKGSSSHFDFPRVKIYITGSNRWREFNQYPPAEIEYKRYYFHSGGKANSIAGDGRLDGKMPQDESPDQYTYDPKNPVSPGAVSPGDPIDHRVVENRDDVLVYTSEALDKPLEVIGRVFVILHAASDASDTDFTANLLDVFPDGRAVKLGSKPVGVIRARYRNGYEREELLTPNKPEKYKIDLSDMGHTFLTGHRIRIEISSSYFPGISPNQNTGNPVATDTEWKIAHQTIFHDKERPSHVLIPVFPKK